MLSLLEYLFLILRVDGPTSTPSPLWTSCFTQAMMVLSTIVRDDGYYVTNDKSYFYVLFILLCKMKFIHVLNEHMQLLNEL